MPVASSTLIPQASVMEKTSRDFTINTPAAILQKVFRKNFRIHLEVSFMFGFSLMLWSAGINPWRKISTAVAPAPVDRSDTVLPWDFQ